MELFVDTTCSLEKSVYAKLYVKYIRIYKALVFFFWGGEGVVVSNHKVDETQVQRWSVGSNA